jgi:phage tail sheath protein FI
MAFQLSPGINISEIDLTTSVPSVSVSTGGMVGAFTWGPALTPITVGSEVDLVSMFGKPAEDVNNTYISFFTGANFLAYSNDLIVSRAANVTSSINATDDGAPIYIPNEEYWFANDRNGSTTNLTSTWAARYVGLTGNSLQIMVFGPANWASASANTNAEGPFVQSIANIFDYAPGTSPWAQKITNSSTLNDEVHIAVIDSKGLFTGVANTVVERFQSVSVLSDAKSTDGSSNFYKEVLYRASKYIHWLKHPTSNTTGWGNTLISAISTGIGQDPAGTVNNKTLSGGADGSISAGEFIGALDVFQNAELTNISLLMTGNPDTTVVNYAVDEIAENRRDCVVFASPSFNAAGDLTSPDTSVVTYTNDYHRSSYLVVDSGWKYQYDKYNDVYRWIPLNGDMAGLCARTDNQRDPWFSPAGITRGLVKNTVKLLFNPNQAQRDLLYRNGINPVVTFRGEGTILYGDKTFLNRPSAFDRINVRRLFIVLERAIATASRSTLFEFNDDFTRAQFVAYVTPFLRTVQSRRGIYNFKVVCDSTNNPPAVVDANQFVGDIYIQPAKSINFIQLNFVATRTGVSFDEVVGTF